MTSKRNCFRFKGVVADELTAALDQKPLIKIDRTAGVCFGAKGKLKPEIPIEIDLTGRLA